MSKDINRRLMEIEHLMRAVNRATINAQIPELTVDGLRPMISLVARARARYLGTLVRLGATTGDATLSGEQLDELAACRREFEELASAAKAFETAIQRGYLDFEGSH